MKKATILLITFLLILLTPSIALADEYVAATTTVTIDTAPTISLQASIESALATEGSGHTAANITHLTIEDGVVYTLTGADIDYIDSALTAITNLNIGNSTLFDYNGDTTPGDVGDSFLHDNDVIISISMYNAITFGNSAFHGCDALTTVSMPLVTTFGDNAFTECSILETISLPSATTFGDGAFEDCYIMTTVSLPDAETFGVYAFGNCDTLTTISLPEAITFGNNAFRGCDLLTAVDLPKAITFGLSAFRDCDSLTSITLPSATTFGDNIFYDCNVLANVNLPVATTFGESAFINCDAIITISLPSATTFGGYPFYACDGLRTVNLPAVTTFGDFAFGFCPGPVSLTLGSTIPTAAANTFGSFPSTTNSIALVPEDRLAAYLAVNDGDTSDQLWWGWTVVGYTPASSPVTRVENPKTGDTGYSWMYLMVFALLVSIVGSIIYINNKKAVH